jgi:hypothetical protein
MSKDVKPGYYVEQPKGGRTNLVIAAMVICAAGVIGCVFAVVALVQDRINASGTLLEASFGCMAVAATLLVVDVLRDIWRTRGTR